MPPLLVDDRQQHAIGPAGAAHGHHAAGRRVADGVVEQVLEHPAQLGRAHQDRRQPVGLADQPHPAGLGAGSGAGDDIGHQVAESHLLGVELQRALVDAGQLEQVVASRLRRWLSSPIVRR